MGSFASGPLHLGHILSRGTLRRPIVAPIAVGLALAGVFVLGAIVIRTIPPLASLAEDVLGYARASNLWIIFVITLVNGVTEELFRGALFAAIGLRYPVLISTIIYSLATVAGGNPVLAPRHVLGTVVAAAAPGRRRRAGANPDPHHLVADHAPWPANLRERTMTGKAPSLPSGQEGSVDTSDGAGQAQPASSTG